MTGGADLDAIARGIIDDNMYVTIGTTGHDGRAWVSPVYFASARYSEFFWISAPEAAHSRNVALRPAVSMVIFDSTVPPNTGQAVYMSAVAEELTGTADFAEALDVYNGRFADPAAHGLRLFRTAELEPPGRHRLYRATASEHWILNARDIRVPVSP